MWGPTRLALALVGLVALAEGKNVKGSFHLDAGDETHGPEFEIAKFSFAVGASKIKGKVKYPAADMNWRTSPALYLFNDEKWDDYHKAPACMDKVQAAHTVVQIGTSTDDSAAGGRRANINYGYDHLSKNTKTSVKQVGHWVEWSFEWTVEHTERTKGWFLIAADCALEQFNTKVASMNYDITLLNPNDNQLPADEFWMPTMYIIVLIAMMVHLGFCLNMLSNTMESSGRVHLVVKLFGCAYLAQVSAIVLELLHLLVYTLNGRGVFILDFTSELLEGCCALVISFVLICLACGWTLVEEEADSKKAMSVATIFANPRNMAKSGNWLGNIFVLLILVLVFYTMMLIFWNKLSDDDFKKFHDNDTASGSKLIQIRLGLFVFFAVSLLATIRKQTLKAGSPILRSFLLKLLVFGSLWFVTFPLMVFIANLSAHYHRHRIVVTGVLVMQSLCLGALSHQFLAGSSTYARLSTAWESGMLPGAGGLFTGTKSRE
eukprot:TRINITY_DN10246_c0_g1_i1.p1 TRINITY_DN10246_c0_g1~~TRINITY_DN10246_c0_g1_i1.p1  ORF type:complete len:490 (+),score=90.58 TRINITY_DN10246_c0_g1_i1:87-1556(+)